MRRDDRFDDIDKGALRSALLALRTCPRCRADLQPVAFTEDVWGCAKCAETWHLHASPSPSTSGDTRAESVAQVPASVKGAVRAWDRSFCREAVCYCHDEASTPRFCGHCGCRPEQAQVSL